MSFSTLLFISVALLFYIIISRMVHTPTISDASCSLYKAGLGALLELTRERCTVLLGFSIPV